MNAFIRSALFSMAAIPAITFATNAQADEDRLRVAMGKLLGEEDVKRLVIEHVQGDVFYKINLDGRVSDVAILDGKVMLGDLYDEKTMQTEANLALVSSLESLIDDIPKKDFITFKPKKPKKVITVFTDLDCGFCRQLHASIEKINEAGIEVRYAPYPRSGPNSESMTKMETVYCSKDRQDALTRAKRGEELEPISCENTVEKNFTAASAKGVSFTPTVFTDDGRLISGFAGEQAFIDEVFAK